MPSFNKVVALLATAALAAEAADLLPTAIPHIVANSYVVVMKDGSSRESLNSHKAWLSSSFRRNPEESADTDDTLGELDPDNSSEDDSSDDDRWAEIYRTFDVGRFKGYHVSLSKAALDEVLSRPEVDYVEHNYVVEPDSALRSGTQKVLGRDDSCPIPMLVGEEPRGLINARRQDDAPWGLSDVSGTLSNVSGSIDSPYYYDKSAGTGTFVYVLDTGVRTRHPEFGGRATFGTITSGSTAEDDVGHGTHVAGIIGASTYGVAKNISLISVKVSGYSGGTAESADIVDGLQWTINDVTEKRRFNMSVINLGFGGALLARSLRQMTDEASDAYIHVVAPAGNGNSSIPELAMSTDVISVGSHDESGFLSTFSNWGPGVDIFVPGENINSTYNDGETKVMDGTSMAAPHVAGVVAYLLGKDGPSTPDEMSDKIKKIATASKTLLANNASLAGSTTNLVLNNGIAKQLEGERLELWVENYCQNGTHAKSDVCKADFSASDKSSASSKYSAQKVVTITAVAVLATLFALLKKLKKWWSARHR